MAEINRNLSFDAGIERVVNYNDWHPLGLPEGTRTLPGESVIEQRLAEVLFPPSVEQALVDSLRPDIEHRDVLTPTGYQAGLEDARSLLEDALKTHNDGPEREKLQSALSLLQEESSLRELLNTYRHLLHRA